NLMNDTDLFAELLSTPHRRVSLRTDFHWLRLTEARDLWYAGSGAGKDNLFGYTGITSNGHRQLAYLVDLSWGVVVHEHVTLNPYYGHAFGQEVVSSSFAGANADYGYLEVLYRY